MWRGRERVQVQELAGCRTGQGDWYGFTLIEESLKRDIDGYRQEKERKERAKILENNII